METASDAVLEKRAVQAGLCDAPYRFSEEHERKMDALFASHSKVDRRIKTATKKKVAAACIFLAASMLMLHSSPVSASMRNLLAKWLGGHAKYSSEQLVEEVGNGEPQILPEGYFLDASIGNGDMHTYVYACEGRAEIVFVRSPASGALALNSDNVEISEETINGIAYHKYRSLKDGVENAVVWEAGGIRCTIFSLEPLEAIWDMAVSVE